MSFALGSVTKNLNIRRRLSSDTDKRPKRTTRAARTATPPAADTRPTRIEAIIRAPARILAVSNQTQKRSRARRRAKRSVPRATMSSTRMMKVPLLRRQSKRKRAAAASRVSCAALVNFPARTSLYSMPRNRRSKSSKKKLLLSKKTLSLASNATCAPA